MTNKEKYKQVFSVLHTSDDFYVEVSKMNQVKKQHTFKRQFTSIVAACVIVIGGVTAAYAADIGGIQRTMQVWIHGDQTEVTVSFDGKGNYSAEYTDADGNVQHQGGGGVAFDENGNERPLSEEELMEEMNAPKVEYKDDGSVWVYWFDQKIDVTDKFENGVCYVQLVSEDNTLYMTIKYEKGSATSPNKYVQPWEFN